MSVLRREAGQPLAPSCMGAAPRLRRFDPWKKVQEDGETQGMNWAVGAPASSFTPCRDIFLCLFSVAICQGTRLPDAEGSSSLEQSLGLLTPSNPCFFFYQSRQSLLPTSNPEK